MPSAKAISFDRSFLFMILGITLFGLVVLTSASSPMGYERFGDTYYFFKHQLFLGIIPGMIAMTTTFFIPYQSWKKYAFPMLLVSILLLSMVFIPGIGQDYGTFANSWVAIGSFTFQPSEVVKLTFLLYLAAWMAKQGDQIKDFQAGLVPFLVILGIIALLMLLQPDLGTLSIIAAMSMVIYFIAGGPILHLLGMAAAGSGLFAVAIKVSPYRAARFMTFLHPELDPQGIGYQINQSLLAIGSGGLFGRGYGHSLQKFQYLPEVAGDSIFAVMSEELGFFFTAMFLIVFVMMLLRGLKIAEGAPDKFGTYLVVGIIAWFGIQALVNVGAMLGIMPITGVPLPFVSYGGTALTVSLAAVGVVLNVSKASARS